MQQYKPIQSCVVDNTIYCICNDLIIRHASWLIITYICSMMFAHHNLCTYTHYIIFPDGGLTYKCGSFLGIGHICMF